MNTPFLYNVKGVNKIVDGPYEKITILKNVDLLVSLGESLAILGASGSGKSTLLHLLAGLDTVTSGDIFMQEKNIATMNDDEKAYLRNMDMGFVFQFHHLLPEFSAVENVAMKALIAGLSQKEALEKANTMLEKVGLSQRAHNKVGTLSGGEQQRVAIARALLLNPKVLFADEPTGNLDTKTSELITDMLVQICQETKMTLVMVTHNIEIATRMQRVFELRSGELYEQNN